MTKCVFSSSIIDRLFQTNPQLAIAYFFFDGRDSQKKLQDHDSLIRAIISQVSHKCYGGIPAELVALYNHYGDHQQPPTTKLQDTLEQIFDKFSHTYIVIDALDECSEQEKTLNWISKIISGQKVENLHLMVTSQPLVAIERVLGKLDPQCIDVVEATENQDIELYLNIQMESKFLEYNKETRLKIQTELAEHADGSYVHSAFLVHFKIIAYNFPRFRWVALQLVELEKCSNLKEIMWQLKNLPKGLDDIYKHILDMIDPKYHADTMIFLQWLAFCQRPMSIAEIAEAITVDLDSEDGPVFDPINKYANPQNVLVRCSSLISESEGTISFIQKCSLC